MYLSRLILNPRNRQVQRELGNPYELHRTLLTAFPNAAIHAQRNQLENVGLLFRLETQTHSNLPMLLVQSQAEPDWTLLAAEYLWQDANAWGGDENPKVTQVHPNKIRFVDGQRLNFRLRANPTKRMGKSAEYNKGKRVGIYKEEKLIEWLKRKGEVSGFCLCPVEGFAQEPIVYQLQISQDQYSHLEKVIPHRVKEEISGKRITVVQSPNTKHDLMLHSVQFDGILQVTDPAAFLTAIQAGIGSGKAFGFGLLSVAPVR